MKNNLKRSITAGILTLALTGCYKSYFFEDSDDPGLSRFTNRGYNVTSAYINNEPWVSDFSSYGGSAPAYLYRDSTGVSKDTLYISWSGKLSNDSVFRSSYWRDFQNLTISLPIKKNFSRNDFLNWNGKAFPDDSTSVSISLSQYYPYPSNPYTITGPAKIYFVKIEHSDTAISKTGFLVSGLFEGNIGDTIKITKGRFDYEVNNQNLH
jgi:hypothetical protein